MSKLQDWKSEHFANWLITAVLVLVPFHAFLTIWAASAIGHYTALRLWDDVLLVVLALITGWWAVRDVQLRRQLSRSLLVRLLFGYALLTVLLGVISLLKHDVTLKACGYGVLVNLRFLVWFVAVWAAAQRSSFLSRNWPKLVLLPAAVVVIFAALQYTVLPHYFLAHFGYNAATNVAPIETINHNQHYIRVQSFLRGANPLGAYLVIVTGMLAMYLRAKRRRWMALAAVVVTLFALYATGSRSAWLGSVLALAVVGWLALKGRQRTIFSAAATVVVVVAAAVFLLLRNNVGLENALLHTQKHSAVATSSNSAHASALNKGLHDIVHQPFGDGAGTAGPASVYNTGHEARIAENYFVQIAQETGWLGLALLLAIFWLVASELYARAAGSRLSLALLASFLGLIVVSLFSHAWTDDTLAFIWWGLAGIALAQPSHKATSGK